MCRGGFSVLSFRILEIQGDHVLGDEEGVRDDFQLDSVLCGLRFLIFQVKPTLASFVDS